MPMESLPVGNGGSTGRDSIGIGGRDSIGIGGGSLFRRGAGSYSDTKAIPLYIAAYAYGIPTARQRAESESFDNRLNTKPTDYSQ